MSLYRIELTFVDAHCRVDIQDEAVWAVNDQTIFNATTNDSSLGVSIALLSLKSLTFDVLGTNEANKAGNARLFLYINTRLETLTLGVTLSAVGVVGVTGPSGDGFADQTPGNRVHTIRLT